MSKLIPDPQIQSLRAMRAGDIAFANGGTITIGKVSAAAPSPFSNKSVNPVAVESTPALAGTPSDSPLVGVVDATTLSVDAAESISLAAVNALETLSGTPSESPTVGVGTGTSVV